MPSNCTLGGRRPREGCRDLERLQLPTLLLGRYVRLFVTQSFFFSLASRLFYPKVGAFRCLSLYPPREVRSNESLPDLLMIYDIYIYPKRQPHTPHTRVTIQFSCKTQIWRVRGRTRGYDVFCAITVHGQCVCSSVVSAARPQPSLRGGQSKQAVRQSDKTRQDKTRPRPRWIEMR